MSTTIERTGALTDRQKAAIEALLLTVSQHDGVRPLNEAAMYGLAGTGHVVHWLAWRSCELVGYAQCNRDDHSVQLFVHPDHRRQGVGRQLADKVAGAQRSPTWWAFGRLPGADGLAASLGIHVGRELLIMERDLVAHPPSPDPVPEDVVLRTYTPADAEALVEVNQLAFAEHPEQGEMSLEDFRTRTAEDWFRAEDLLVAADDETGALLGFHWTRTEHSDPAHPEELVGEVYVIGVHPDASGRGVGRALLSAGLAHLADLGVKRVVLYVEASAERVVAMYRSASFVEVTRDASYTS